MTFYNCDLLSDASDGCFLEVDRLTFNYGREWAFLCKGDSCLDSSGQDLWAQAAAVMMSAARLTPGCVEGRRPGSL